ncbi:MAG: hypothetical protein E7397_08385 [Ruminococcaceae bacterium]|nr:hypothetical protein [Oscillospiraceae bacterium]
MGYWILDILLVAVIACVVWFSMKKGFIKASYHAISVLVTILVVFAFQAPFQEFLEESALGDLVREKVAITVNQTVSEHEELQSAQADENALLMLIENLPLPEFIHKFLEDTIIAQSKNLENLKEGLAESVTKMVSSVLMQLVSIVLLFLLVRLGLFILFRILNAVAKLPVINFFNKVLGAVMGAINALLVVYIACALVMLLTPVSAAEPLNEAINQTYLLKYFYQNNLLMTIFLR